MSFFENLKLDVWFKAVTYLGGVIFILAVFVPVQAGSNELIALFGAGMFLLGVGRWKNQKTFTGIQDRGFGGFVKMSMERRSPDILGLLLEISGWVLLVYVAGRVILEFAQRVGLLL